MCWTHPSSPLIPFEIIKLPEHFSESPGIFACCSIHLQKRGTNPHLLYSISLQLVLLTVYPAVLSSQVWCGLFGGSPLSQRCQRNWLTGMIFHSHTDWVSDYFEYESWTELFGGFAKMMSCYAHFYFYMKVCHNCLAAL